ncbi:hypothetical protein H3N56_10375 [Cetobacterium sp. 2A]|nr:hypothetical protein [Cetobacterium sp. 2A]MBC2855317.1 hypothetical protein [Cetobacterium sp. 2A]MBC2856805.1 hypothetical protein [Cetobacterium sp. 2A]MBC2856846.1 hypothetical protein [Cetobacterium sp. 2A]
MFTIFLISVSIIIFQNFKLKSVESRNRLIESQLISAKLKIRLLEE